MNRRQFLTSILGVSGVAIIGAGYLIDLDKPINASGDIGETRQIAHVISPSHCIEVKISGEKRFISVGDIA